LDALTWATLKVLTDGQAYVHALIHAGADAPDEDFKAAMNDYKQDHAALISELLEGLAHQAAATQEEMDEQA